MTVLAGDGTQGYPAKAPYARVIATVAVRVGEQITITPTSQTVS